MLRLILLPLLLCLSLAAAADVYRWVDKDGNVHYGDQPKGNKAERLSSSRPEFGESEDTEDTAEGEAAPEPTPIKETPFAGGKENATARERCEEFRARVKRYKNAGDMFIDNPDGTRHKLVPEERERLISRTQQQADKACAEAGA